MCHSSTITAMTGGVYLIAIIIMNNNILGINNATLMKDDNDAKWEYQNGYKFHDCSKNSWLRIDNSIHSKKSLYPT